jgi:hypothetical protein
MSAVHAQTAAGDEAGVLRAQEQYRLRNLLSVPIRPVVQTVRQISVAILVSCGAVLCHGFSVQPGITALTRMRSGARSRALAADYLFNAALVAG